MVASYNGHIEVVETCIRQGANVNLEDNVSALTQVHV